MAKTLNELRQVLNENAGKIAAFTFGRFNPPTIGHEKLIDAIMGFHGATSRILYVSRKEGENKNPIDVKTKKKVLSDIAGPAISVESKHDIKDVFDDLKKRGFHKAVMFVGEDRVDSFQAMADSIDGISIEVRSVGERDPESDDEVEAATGTKVRQAAIDGDFGEFIDGLHSKVDTKTARAIYDAIRKVSGVTKSSEEIRESYIAGSVHKVGSFVRVVKTETVGRIIDTGPNYVTIIESNGSKTRHWIKDVVGVSGEFSTEKIRTKAMPENQILYYGYQTQNLTEEVYKAFAKSINGNCRDKYAMLEALKATDALLGELDRVLCES